MKTPPARNAWRLTSVSFKSQNPTAQLGQTRGNPLDSWHQKINDSQTLHTCDWKISPQHHLPILIHKYPQKHIFQAAKKHVFSLGFALYYFGGTKMGESDQPLQQSQPESVMAEKTAVLMKSADRPLLRLDPRAEMATVFRGEAWVRWKMLAGFTEFAQKVPKELISNGWFQQTHAKKTWQKPVHTLHMCRTEEVHNHPDHVSLAFMGLMCMRGSEA